MRVLQLRLRNFRNYDEMILGAEHPLPNGLIAITGQNGFGKTNLVEALAFLSLAGSFRGSPSEAMVKRGSTSAVVRGEIEDGSRQTWIEAEIQASGRNRVLVNRQKATRRQTLEALSVSIFAPSDLDVIQDGPQGRREVIDDAIVALHPPHESIRSRLDRVLRQRNALLKSARGTLDESASVTLEVWDSQLAELGDRWARLRIDLIERVYPGLCAAYREISKSEAEVSMRYQSSWQPTGLGPALKQARVEEVRRGVTLVGPHRDDIDFGLNGLPARNHASQGEQRSLAIALRLAIHRSITDEMGTPPVLVLDDVLSELDPYRREALVRGIPEGQIFLTSAGDMPTEVKPQLHVVLNERGMVSVL